MKTKHLLIGLALAIVGLRTEAAIGSLDNVPAATLLLPYFEVDTSSTNGVRTTMTIGNTSSSEQVAHVTIWGDLGVPTLNFDIRLPARGVAEFNLRDLFVNGTIPASTPGGFASCSALPLAPLNATLLTHMRAAHAGAASTVLGGNCAGSVSPDGRLRGYVTVDVTTACTTLSPADASYFAGVASNSNVLWGEYSITDPAASQSFGDALVHIEASTSDPATDGAGDYTFYGRLVAGSGADHRERLPQVYSGRYARQSTGSAFSNTRAIIWRDPGDVAPFSCASRPSIANGSVMALDHQENVSEAASPFGMPKASQTVDLNSAAIPFSSGYLAYGLANGDGTFGGDNQGFVTHVRTSIFGDTAAHAAAFGDSSILTNITYPACADGIDNDGDNAIDFPADTDCLSAAQLSENPECSDGINNDGDGLTDFPADPGCASPTSLIEDPACDDDLDNDADMVIDFPADSDCGSAYDENEGFAQQCRDFIDNDQDGLVDWPADPNCFSPFDNLEAPGVCSDGLDNDGDMLIDFPNDPDCSSGADNTEDTRQCSDGISNDADGLIDFPADPGCQSADSNNEAPQCDDDADNDMDGDTDFPADAGCAFAYSNQEGTACDDGIDNDADMLIDFPNDPGCAAATSNTENPQCNDGFDNDFDMLTDFPNDPGCTSASDTNEFDSECNDGVDNDNDGLIDFPFSPSCSSASDPNEAPDCSDTADNDFDSLVDFGNDAGCASAADLNELDGTVTRQCSDGIDNDGDLFVDYPQDPGCSSAYDDVEYLPNESRGAPTPVPGLNAFGLGLLAAFALLLGLFTLRSRTSPE